MSTTIVVPCFNEAQRFPTAEYLRFARTAGSPRLLFVNDGSTDYTAEVLNGLRSKAPSTVDVLHLEQNVGKAAAVRLGVLHALRDRPGYVGYWDADLATPLDAIADFIRVLDRREEIDLVVGCRMPLLGRRIVRNPWRQRLGRSFAQVASRMLRLSIFDTQCGAKLFRANNVTAGLFATPFLTGWIFDVELIARLANVHGGMRQAAAKMYELPLDRWEDVPGSNLRPQHFVKAVGELARIYHNYLRPWGPRYAPPPPAEVTSPVRKAA